MRRIIGLVLTGLFGFLLVTALMGWFYAPGQVKVTPLNIDSATHLSGSGSYMGKGPAKMKAVSNTVVLGDESDEDVVVFTSTSCVVWDEGSNTPDCVDGKDKRLVTASEDLFATSRVTGLSVNDEKYVGVGQQREGLVNKFPFDVEQRTYPFWDGTLKKAVDAEFQGVEELVGHQAYHFLIDVRPTQTEIAKGVKGTYQDQKDLWVDPATGSILKQAEHQQRSLPDGTKVVDLKLAFTDEQVASNVDDAKGNGSKLAAVRLLPWIALGLALLSLVGGILLLRGTRPAAEDGADATYDATRRDDTTVDDTNRFFEEANDTTRRRRDV